MRSAMLTCIFLLFLLAHHTHAFDIYLNKESDCSEDKIDIVCENQRVGSCCNGLVRTLYSSAQASDDQGNVVLYGLDQGQDPEAPNRCGLPLVIDDDCSTTDVPMGSAAGALGIEGDPRFDQNPTDGTAPDGEDGEDNGGGAHGREHAKDFGTPPKKETWIEKNAKVKRGADGWRQQQWTAYAVRSGGYVWKLSRDSELIPAFETLTDEKEQVDFVKRHGVRQLF